MTTSCSPAAERFPEIESSFNHAFIQMSGVRKPKSIVCIKPGFMHDELPRHGLSLLEQLSAEMQQLRANLEHATVERDMLRNGHRILCLTTSAWGRRKQGNTAHPTSLERIHPRATRNVAKRNSGTF